MPGIRLGAGQKKSNKISPLLRRNTARSSYTFFFQIYIKSVMRFPSPAL